MQAFNHMIENIPLIGVVVKKLGGSADDDAGAES